MGGTCITLTTAECILCGLFVAANHLIVMSVLVYLQLKRSSTESNFESLGTNQTLFKPGVCKTLCFNRILDS